MTTVVRLYACDRCGVVRVPFSAEPIAESICRTVIPVPHQSTFRLCGGRIYAVRVADV